jgi:hypothetical protein
MMLALTVGNVWKIGNRRYRYLNTADHPHDHDNTDDDAFVFLGDTVSGRRYDRHVSLTY